MLVRIALPETETATESKVGHYEYISDAVEAAQLDAGRLCQCQTHTSKSRLLPALIFASPPKINNVNAHRHIIPKPVY